MSDDRNPGDGERTVFQPLPGATAQPPLTPPPPNDDPGIADVPPPPPAAVTGFQTSSVPPSEARDVRVGDVLNHIFEVKRFIARGGMGEVFEGINVNSDERVAIKVMLPSLAADPNVQAMFRKEARTLTRLSHPALVQYRVLAQEPQLGVFYIVTDYIDGSNLSDVLRTIETTPADLVALTRRLAEGLRAAHALGAIHRDISPDNVVLEGGRIEGAKIIDFGIAKDLDPGSATIVGDGFAGKLAYVAPEQLGDFGREVGPWSDVYSLGLVILAVALNRDVDMGGSLVDAVDKRRAGPDLSAVPETMRPILVEMLRANPADRVRSMDALITLIDGRGALSAPPTAPSAQSAQPKAAPGVATTRDAARKKLMLLGGGGAALLALIVVGGLALTGKHQPVAPAPAVSQAAASAATGDPIATTRDVLAQALGGVTCTWLDATSVSGNGDGVKIAFNGAAGHPADAQAQITRMLQARGVTVADINFERVAPIEASECAGLDAFRQIRNTGAAHMSVPQNGVFQRTMQSDGDYKGQLAALVVMNFDLGAPGADTDAALFGIEPSGKITPLLSQRSDFDGLDKVGPNQFRLQMQINHLGMSGMMLITGRKPFDPTMIAGPPGSRGGDWPTRFLARAQQQGWKSEMVWVKTIDAH